MNDSRTPGGDSMPTPDQAALEAERARIAESYPFDENGFTRFDPVSDGELGNLGQYTSQFVDGFDGKPKLGEGLLFEGDPADFSSLRIHRDSILPFKQRVREYREEQMRKAMGEE